MDIVGVDASMTSSGIAVFHEQLHKIETHRLRSKAPAAAPGQKKPFWDQRFDRLDRIVDAVVDVVPDNSFVILEGGSYGSVGSASHDIAGTWWSVARALRGRKNCRILVVAPTTLKMYVTGSGNAGKDEVLAAAIRRYESISINGNDEADAVVLMDIGLRLLGRPLGGTLTAKQERALPILKPEFDRLFNTIS